MARYVPASIFVIVVILAGHAIRNAGGEAIDADSESSQLIHTVAELKAEVQRLKDKAPDQAHAMDSVDYHFANLWFAAKAENWPLAEFYWKETVSHMRWAVRIIPVRKDNAGKEVKLQEILQSIEQSPFMQVGKTIEERDVSAFETAYRSMLEGCYSCHKASDKPYLRPGVPDRPASAMMNFDPAAKWPQ
jgi:hypothetical protein